MSKYTINIELTDSEELALQAIAVKAGKTVAQIFQEFWDGYTAEDVHMTGTVRSQINSWIAGETKAKIAELGDAETLAILNQ